ncbi:MAG: winged helix-turn-helix domain-containing protein [Patescibacteria group bacterium]
MSKSIDDILVVFNKNKLLILKSLYDCTDFLCGCNLVDKLKIPKNLLSYHVKKLKDLGYIEETRCGKNKQYRISASRENKIRKILEVTELIKERNEKSR